MGRKSLATSPRALVRSDAGSELKKSSAKILSQASIPVARPQARLFGPASNAAPRSRTQHRIKGEVLAIHDAGVEAARLRCGDHVGPGIDRDDRRAGSGDLFG